MRIDYVELVRIYEKDLTRRVLSFCLMAVVAMVAGIGYGNILLALISSVIGAVLFFCFNNGVFKLGWPQKITVISTTNPTDKNDSLYRLRYRDLEAPIDKVNLDFLRVRHYIEDTSDD